MSQEAATQLWTKVCDMLTQQEETNNPATKAYLSYMDPLSLDSNKIVLSTRLSVAKEKVEDNYLGYIGEALFRLGQPCEVVIIVHEDSPQGYAQPTMGPLISHVAQPDAEQDSARAALHSQPQAQPSDVYQRPQAYPDAARAASIPHFNPALDPAPSAQAAFPPHPDAAALLGHPAQADAASPSISFGYKQAQIDAGSRLAEMDYPLNHYPLSAAPSSPQAGRAFNFDSFVVGESNDFAFAAARGAAEMPGIRFNPLFIYGKSGLGKTQ